MSKLNYNYILCRIASEIFLKGKNQYQFVSRLTTNVKLQTGQQKVLAQRGRILLPFFEEHHKLKSIFGIQSYSPSVFIEKSEDIEEYLIKIKLVAVELMQNREGTFHIQTKRSDKSFSFTSIEVNHKVGGEIETSNTKLSFQLKQPKNILGIEITDKGTFIFNEQINCEGGLPAGMEGEATIEIFSEVEVVAALCMIRRGVDIKFIKNTHFPKYSKLIQSFYPKKLKTVSSVKEYQHNCAQNACVIVVGDNLSSLKYTTKKENAIILAPLIAWTPEQINTEFKRYQKISDNI